MKKLCSKRGETLTEVLVSVLIIALSAAMLATMVSTAVNINIKTKAAIDDFYAELSAAEGTDTLPDTATVDVDGTGVTVKVYSDSSASTPLTSYEKQ